MQGVHIYLAFAILAWGSSLVVQGQDLLNSTTALEDFVIQNQRQYAATIENLQGQLAAFKANYLQQLKALDVQTSLIEERLVQTEQRLNPLERLGGLNKHCVQKYRNGITTTASVKASISRCTVAASNTISTFTSPAEATTTNLNNYYNNQLRGSLSDCAKRYMDSQFNHTLCVTQVVSNANAVTANSLKTFKTQLQQADCSAETRISQSLDCAFITLYSTISSIGESVRLIDDCIAGKEIQPTCPSCDNTVLLQWYPSDFKNVTVKNPFLGQLSNHSCTTVQFVQYL